jgi:exonuclease III
LVNKKLGFKKILEHKDLDENILIIRFEKNGAEFVLGSVYGPNSTDRTFYNNITNFLNQNLNLPVVLGGDWNTTWDNSAPDFNIDLSNMVRPPNAANGKLLRDLATRFNLTDPFRALFPDKIAFSYAPFGTQRKNRARLDFFVISSSLIQNISSCGIFSAPLSCMFDHKPVFYPSIAELKTDLTKITNVS